MTETAKTEKEYNSSFLSGRALWSMVAILLATDLLASLMQSIMNVALDDTAELFHVSLSMANWVVLGYAIVTGTIISMGASLLKRFGLRRILLFSYVCAIAGSLLSFVAVNFPMLVAGRFVQAVTTGLAFPTVNAVLVAIAPKKQAAKLLAVVSGMIGIGLALAPPIAGLIITHVGLREIFLIPILFAAAMIVIGWFAAKDVMPREHRRIDIPSVVLCFAGLGLFVYGLNEITHNPLPSAAVCLGGIFVLGIFIWRQSKLSVPLLSMKPFKTKVYSLGEVLIVFTYMTSMFASLLAPIYLEGVMGCTTFMAGVLLIVPILCYSATCFLSPRLSARHGLWPLIPIGFCISLVSAVALYFIADAKALVPFLAATATLYMGIGIIYPSIKTRDLESLPKEIAKDGSSIHSTLVQIAGSIGSALFVGMMSGRADTMMSVGAAKPEAYASGFMLSLLAVGCILAAGVIVAVIYSRLGRDDSK